MDCSGKKKKKKDFTLIIHNVISQQLYHVFAHFFTAST